MSRVNDAAMDWNLVWIRGGALNVGNTGDAATGDGSLRSVSQEPERRYGLQRGLIRVLVDAARPPRCYHLKQ